MLDIWRCACNSPHSLSLENALQLIQDSPPVLSFAAESYRPGTLTFTQYEHIVILTTYCMWGGCMFLLVYNYFDSLTKPLFLFWLSTMLTHCGWFVDCIVFEKVLKPDAFPNELASWWHIRISTISRFKSPFHFSIIRSGFDKNSTWTTSSNLYKLSKPTNNKTIQTNEVNYTDLVRCLLSLHECMLIATLSAIISALLFYEMA